MNGHTLLLSKDTVFTLNFGAAFGDSYLLMYTENGSLTLQIPEPATTGLAMLGICALAIRRRRASH